MMQLKVVRAAGASQYFITSTAHTSHSTSKFESSFFKDLWIYDSMVLGVVT